MTKHKLALVFLSFVNIINLAAGVLTQLKLITGSDITSVIPITVDMTVDQILMLNFLVVSIVLTLISVVTTYLVTDVSYSIKEIVSNCAGVFLILPIILLFVAAFNMVNAQMMIDKASIIISAIIYLFLNVLNFGCIITVKEDE